MPPVTTRCVIAELESLGEELRGATFIAKRFQQRRCSHGKKKIPAADCILSLTGTMEHGLTGYTLSSSLSWPQPKGQGFSRLRHQAEARLVSYPAPPLKKEKEGWVYAREVWE